MSTKTAIIQASIVSSGLVMAAIGAFAVGAYAESPEPVTLKKDQPACDVTDKINRKTCPAALPLAVQTPQI